MMSARRSGEARGDFWIIRPGESSRSDLGEIGIPDAQARTYRISDFARYLVNPKSIEIERKLIGCEVHGHQSLSADWRSALRRRLPKRLSGWVRDTRSLPEVLISPVETKTLQLNDKRLEAHINKIYGLLRPYDIVSKKLSALDPDKVSDIVGICMDIAGNRSKMQIQGSIEEKIEYVLLCLLKDVAIILDRAHLGNGLFELGGFDFLSFDSSRASTLVTFQKEGQNKSAVLRHHGGIDFWLEDEIMLKYLHLLEQSVQTNPKFLESLGMCVRGEARALKLLFNQDLEINYSGIHPPETFREVFQAYNINPQEREELYSSINHSQMGVSLNYVLLTEPDLEKMFTNISVMHDFQALEPLRESCPLLYSAISQRAQTSEAGRYYLLDSIKGCRNEE